MLYITDRGIEAVKEHSGKENFISISNAIYIRCKNNYYTYLKNGCFLMLNKAFNNDYLHDRYYFSQIQEISVEEQEKYKELVLSKIKNIDDINDISFKGFYLADENIL